jgi:hypothetical protein
LAAVSAGEGREWLVARALWRRWQAVKASWHGGGGAEVAHCPGALPGDRSQTCGGGMHSGISRIAGLRQASPVVLVEAARSTSGPLTHAVGERGVPLTGLPALVARRREHRLTGVCTRPESRSLATRGPHATGSRQTGWGKVTQRSKKAGEKNIRTGA